MTVMLVVVCLLRLVDCSRRGLIRSDRSAHVRVRTDFLNQL